MTDKTITAANSVFTLVVAGLFPSPVQLNGYATDKAFMMDAADQAEVVMGVDGKMSAGYTPNVRKTTISLQADSNGRTIFSAITQAQKTAKEVYFMSGNITLPGTGEAFVLTRGVLQNNKDFPDAAKTLQSMDFVIVWESINQTDL